MLTILGTCSCCGGRVTVPTVYMSVVPPVPTCESCGAVAASHGPVVQMQPVRPAPALRNRMVPSVSFHGGGSGG